jgi:DNA repair ATPase RecN
MSDADINHFSVLMEQQNAKLDAVLEYVAEMPKAVHRLGRIEQDVAELKQDMKVVRAAVTATNRDLAKHKSLPTQVAHGHA